MINRIIHFFILILLLPYVGHSEPFLRGSDVRRIQGGTQGNSLFHGGFEGNTVKKGGFEGNSIFSLGIQCSKTYAFGADRAFDHRPTNGPVVVVIKGITNWDENLQVPTSYNMEVFSPLLPEPSPIADNQFNENPHEFEFHSAPEFNISTRGEGGEMTSTYWAAYRADARGAEADLVMVKVEFDHPPATTPVTLSGRIDVTNDDGTILSTDLICSYYVRDL
jgi:hypothetical protein